MAKKTYKDWSKEDLISRIEKLEKRKKYGLVWDEERTRDLLKQHGASLTFLPSEDVSQWPEGLMRKMGRLRERRRGKCKT